MPKRSVAAATPDEFVDRSTTPALGRIRLSPVVQHAACAAVVILAVVWNWQALTTVITRSLKSSNGNYEHYSHIILLPFLSGYLLYVTRDAIARHARPAIGPGILLTLAGAVLGRIGASTIAGGNADNGLSIAMSSVVTMWTGGFLFSYGGRAFRAGAYAFFVLLFMVPFPPATLDAIIVFLQHASADVSAVLFALIGMPAYREDLVFALPGLTIQVARECSGIRSSLALFISGLAMAYLLFRKNWTRTVFLLAIIPVAIVKNAIRIVGLSWLAVHIDPSFITGSAVHRSSGIPIFLGSLMVLFGLTWLLRKCERETAR